MSTSYLAVLRTPGAARLIPAALLGRLSYGTAPLSLLLAAADTTGSYARAGWLMAVFSAVSVLLFPYRAGLVDRYGPRRVLPPMALGYAAALLALAATTWRPGTPSWALLPLAAAAGALAPPLGPVTRAQWSVLAADPELRRRAYSLDTVAEELLYVTGPLLAGLLTATTRPAAGLLLSAVLALTGTLALAAVAVPVAPRDPAAPTPPRTGTRHLLGRARQPLSAAAGAGAGLAAFSLLAVVFAARHGRPADVAWVEAALAAGSAVGGLALGAIDWRAPARTRLTLLTAALGTALALAALAPTLPALTAVAALAGLAVAPTLTTAYLRTDELATPAERTRAGAWVNTSFNAGSSGATALTGTLLAHLPLTSCLLLAAAPTLAALACRGTPPRPRDADEFRRPAPSNQV
ncbi:MULTISPECIES: MFS transporter [Kitasatospora]|uniref:Putative major facilitator superfamily transporter n=1 Tax=Kitasatospora setae (strain ATCC 33774 / DSM 43861 / JCM 3304 / KCC A-0304 / NBRC 14216 / KM-6054) TaxID=452652 RepID=E4N1H3_KITSK|nr:MULTISPECIES: MFS transporter [Kitasatospora]BAJ32007.1 putative major facilitator superfamily transporter [Kitasatospora setae KM-6054]